MARHSLHLEGRVDQFLDLRVGVVHPLQLGRDFQCALQRHLQFHRDLLCDHIHILVGHPHHTAHVTDGVAGGHGAKGDDLRHMVSTVFPVDVVDDFLTALIAEVHVKVGHTDTFGVQETLEDEVVADGVDVGDADAVGRNAACTRTTARPHRDALALGVVDIIPDDQIVVRVAHRLDHADLVGQAVFVGLRDIGAVAALQTLPAELFKKSLVVHPVGRFVVGDFGVAEVKVKVTLVRDLLGVLAGLRHHGEQIVHFIRRLDVKLIGLELHLIGVLHGLAGLDAEKDALHFGVFPAQIVGVVGGGHRDARLPRQLDELGQNDGVLFQAVVLQLNVVIAFAKQVPVPQCRVFCPLVVPRQNGLRDLARQTGRKADEPFVVLFEQLLINAGLGVKPLGEGCGDHLDEVLVAGLIFAQQDQMVVAVDLVDLIEPGASGNVDFAADDGLDARFSGRFIKLHTAVHDTVVGAGDGRLPALLHAVHQLVDAAGTVQQAVFRMDMEVDEIPPQVIVFADLAHVVSSCSIRSRMVCASSSSFFIRCDSPDLLTGGSKQAQSAVNERSGFSNRLAAACCSTSGRVSSAFCSCKKRMAFSVCALARAVLPRLAVSQLVWRLIWFRICFTAFCALICAAAWAAPINARMRSTLAQLLT